MPILETLGIAVKATASKSITAAITKWSYTELTKQFTMFKILSNAGIERPKDEWLKLYFHAVILFAGKGRHKELIGLLLKKEAQVTFRKYKTHGDLDGFLRQLDADLHTDQQISEIKHWSEIPFDQIEEFIQLHDELEISVQSPVQTKLVNSQSRMEGKLDEQTEALESIKKQLAMLTGQSADGGKFAELGAEESDPVNREYQRQLKVILGHINSGLVTRALDELLVLKDAIWDLANDSIKFKVLTNIGVCYFQNDDAKLAHRYLLEAYPYDEDSLLALSNLVNAFMAVEDNIQANGYLEILLEKFPKSVETIVCLIKLRSDELSLEEVEALVPMELKENAEVLAGLGVVNRKKGKMDEAIHLLEKALELKPEHDYIEQHLLQVYVEKYHTNYRLINMREVDLGTKKELEQMLELIDRLLERLAKTDLPKQKARVLMARSFTLDVLKRTEEAFRVSAEALEFDPYNPLILRLRGMQLAFRGDFDDSIAVLSAIPPNPVLPDVPMFLAEVLRNAERFEEAVVVLEDYLSDLTDDFYIEQANYILLDIYVLAGMREKVEGFIVKMEHAVSISDLICLSNANRALGNNDLARGILLDVYQNLKEGTSFKLKYFLVDALTDNALFEESISLLSIIIDVTVYSPMSVKLLKLYERVGRKADALKMMEDLRKSEGPINGITEAEISIYQDLGDYSRARDIATEYMLRFPKNLKMRLRLAGLEMRLENFDVVDAFLEEEIEYYELDIHSFNNYIAILIARKKRKRAYETVYEYRRLKDNLEAHTAYMQIVLQFPLSSEEDGDEDVVGQDCAVVLKNKTGDEYVQILEDRDSGKLRDNEINREHPRFSKLFGKRVGDEVQFANSSQKWMVDQVMGKLKWAFRQSQKKSETVYAENSTIKSFHVDDFWEIIGSMGNPNWQKGLEQINDYYISGKLTFGAMGNKLGKNPFELWDFLRSQQKVGIRCATGQAGELDHFSVRLSQNRVLVLDMLTLLTLHKLEILELVHGYFDQLLITPTTYDLFLDFAEDAGSFLVEGEMNENVSRLMEQVKKYTKVQLPQNLLKINSWEKDNRDEVLGKSFSDSIILAEEVGGVFCSEDFALRSLGMQESGIDVAWSHVLVWHLYQQAILTGEAYQELILKLVRFNYRHTSISNDTLMVEMLKSGFKISSENELVFIVLNGDNSSLDTALIVALRFLTSILLLRDITTKQKADLTYYTLLSLSTGRQVNVFFLEAERQLLLMKKEMGTELHNLLTFCLKLELEKLRHDFNV
jgi:tetratricopeptide (TPR) repeat protein